MKTRYLLVSVLVVMLMVLVSVGTALARPPLDEPGDEQDVPGQEDGDRAGVGAAAYIVNPTMNYQGFLTDSGGSPVNGTLDFTVSLWDQEGAGAGVQEWGPEDHLNVTVAVGLFNLVLGSNLALDVWDFMEALYLEIEVDGTTLPRQPLRGVPYAMTLAPGAVIVGIDDIVPTLSVINMGMGQKAAIEAAVWGPNNYGLLADKIYSVEGYASGEDSFLWVPGSLAYTLSGDVDLHPQNTGILWADCTAAGIKLLYVPVAIPSRLYGHDVVVEEARVYYRVTSTGSPVYDSLVRKLKSDGTTEDIAHQPSAQDSMTYTSFSVPIDATKGYTLTDTAGPLTVGVGWTCSNDTHNLYLGGVRLRLGHPRSDQ